MISFDYGYNNIRLIMSLVMVTSEEIEKGRNKAYILLIR